MWPRGHSKKIKIKIKKNKNKKIKENGVPRAKYIKQVTKKEKKVMA